MYVTVVLPVMKHSRLATPTHSDHMEAITHIHWSCIGAVKTHAAKEKQLHVFIEDGNGR